MKIRMIGVGLLCLMSSVCRAEDAALTLADLIGGKDQYNQLNHQVLQEMIRKQPALTRYQVVVQQWAKEYVTWERMRAELAQTYHSHFTNAEIARMLVFFSTPEGQKYIRYAPLLREEMVQIGQRVAREQQPRLIQMLKNAGAHVEVRPTAELPPSVR